MPFMEWSDVYSVQVPEIDEDHKHLFDLMNELHDAVEAKHGHEVLAKTLDGLIQYVSHHFNHEEGLFLRTGYPGYEEHKREHELLTGQALDVQAKFLEGRSETLPEEVLQFLKDWLCMHTTGSDRKFGVFVNTSGIEL